jgi:cell division protein FtsB
MPPATASVRVATVAPDSGTASELVSALVAAVDRAARAEAKVDALTAENGRLQAQVRELEADLHLTTTDLRAVNARVERVMVHWHDALRARRAR